MDRSLELLHSDFLKSAIRLLATLTGHRAARKRTSKAPQLTSAHAVVREATAAGVWIFGGGLQRQQSSIEATDGTITDGPVPETKAVVGGFSIIEVASREDALVWAARIANACRCAQEVREIMFDAES